MKRTLILATFLCSSALCAEQTLEDAKKQLEIAQANYNAALNRASKLKEEISITQKQSEEVAGKAEQNAEVEEYRTKVRRQIEEHNAAVDACKTKLADLQKSVAEIGKEHKVVTQGENLTVVKPEAVRIEQPRMEQGMRKDTDMARQPYATKGATYPRAIGQ